MAQKVEDQLIAGLKAEGDVIVKNIDDTIADIVDLNTKLDTDIHKTEVRDKIKNGLLDSIGDDSTRISYIKRKTEVYISIRDRLTGNYS
ncbi:MAG: hypothetical protein H6767_06645 [Candidatus Peribacteria bacterium]|nr:MAG: hypothetical protein H6767_06645 [Candidatus Peribacteria bacterium]